MAKDRGHDSNYPKGDTDKDDPGLLPGSDPDDDPDLGSGESDGDWSQDDMDAEIRRVKVSDSGYTRCALITCISRFTS